jgi:DNA-binding LacI/PurR family transcriptional regulator
MPRTICISAGSNISQLVYPPLTTVRQPVAEMTALATSFLIDEKRQDSSVTLQMRLVVRRSTSGFDEELVQDP